MRILSIFYLCVLLCFSVEVLAQNSATAKGDKLYLKGEYFQALENYKKAEKDGITLDTRTSIKKAICMYQLSDIEAAFNILSENTDKLQGEEILFYALTAHKFGFYDGAIEYYEKAKQAGSNPGQIDELIASCRWALANNVINRDVKINPVSELYTGGVSFGLQFYKNGIVYSSAEEGAGSKNLDKQGKQILNLYFSEIKDGKVQPTKRLFSKNLVFNTHVGAIAFTTDYAMMYYSRVVRVKGGDTQVKIYSTKFDGKDWGDETDLVINSDDYSCAYPTVSADNRFLYFVSNKPGGYGRKDIYVCERSKNGDLGEPKNLGSTINTFNDEISPFMSKDNTLFFSSDGRNGFGGLDIYSSKKVGEKWGSVTNLQHPYNFEKDDFGYVIDPTNVNFGFISSNRLGTGVNDAFFSIEKTVVDSLKSAPIVAPVKDSVVLAPVVVAPVVVAPPVEEPVYVAPVVVAPPVVVTPPVVVAPVVVAPVVVAPPVNTLPAAISSSIISTFNGTPISGVSVAIKDLSTGQIVGNVKSSAAGKFVFNLPAESRVEGREFELALSKGSEFMSKKMIVNIQEIEDLNKNGLTLTPIFNDAVLDDISGMVIPFVGNEITPGGLKILESLSAYMAKNPNIVIKLNGHTDARGDKLTNLRVGQTMAEKAETLLIKNGIKDENIIPRSYGERYILNKCKRGVYCDNATHLSNRRIEVIVWKMSK